MPRPGAALQSDKTPSGSEVGGPSLPYLAFLWGSMVAATGLEPVTKGL